MASDRVAKQLEHLQELRAAGISEKAFGDLRKALADRVNVIVARATAIASEWRAHDLLPDLLNTYSRLFIKAAETDPQCWAKNELAKCFKELGLAESAVFLRGLQHVQLESTWGGKTDTATVLRSTCALALVQCSDLPRHQILLHLVNALTEEEPTVRAETARALEQMGGRDASLLLRLKARSGDKEARVTGQVLECVLALEGAAGVEFVVAFLRHKSEEVNAEAALALGASRLPESVDALKTAWLNTRSASNSMILLRAMSASRQDSALDFLLEQIRSARSHAAEDALRALALHRDSEEIVKRIEKAVAGRDELKPRFRQYYENSPNPSAT